jgi:glycosyltransferase involved in cell wall biosynthesis
VDAKCVSTPWGQIYLPSRTIGKLLDAQEPATVLLVDGWESPAYWQAAIAARRVKVPVIASYRSTPQSHRFVRGLVPRARSLFLRSMNAVLTAGPASSGAVRSAGVPESRTFISFNAVDVGFFAQAIHRRSGPHSPHRFLYVGQLIPRKNVDGLVRALAVLDQRGIEASLTIVGVGAMMAEVSELVETCGMADRVQFRLHLEGDELLQAFADADTLVLPSHEEVWGLVVNEALAAGLHAVVTSPAGIVPSVSHMRGVFVTEPSDDRLAEGMQRSLEAWAGPIHDAEILAHTPQASADAVARAVQAVLRSAEADFK